MMRSKTGIGSFISALLFIGACAWGDGSTPKPTPGGGGDDQMGDVCGDGTCSSSEVGVCADDCGTAGSGSGSNPGTVSCGDGTCTPGSEDTNSCPTDCGVGSGSGSGSSTLNCSDQNTQFACFACIAGLGCTGVNETDCMTCLAGGGGGGVPMCEGGTPDGMCNAAAGEDATTCPFDCM